MKVKELIAALQAQDPEAMVVLAGYEGGVREAEATSSCTVALNVNSESQWYYGPHEVDGLFNTGWRDFSAFNKEKAVFIS